MSVAVFSGEKNITIGKVRNSVIVTFDEVNEISRWISDEVGFSKIRSELANIDCTKGTKRSMCLTGCTFNRRKVKRGHDRKMVQR